MINKALCELSMLWILCYLTLIIAARLDTVRDLMKRDPKLDPFVTISNAAISGQLAYTSNDLRRIYVDFLRLAKTPNTLHNVIKHELSHSKGGFHGDGSREMSYSVSTTPNGDIAEDGFLL